MFDVLFDKVKEVLYSVLPITVIVILLNFTIAPLPFLQFIHFIIGAGFIVIGLSIFLFGVDIGITPLGNHIGASISKLNKVWIVVVLGLILGFFICVAEPDLHVLASQVSSVTSGAIAKDALLIVVSLGVAVLLIVGLLRIVFNVRLHIMLTVLYSIIFLLSLFIAPEFLAIAFDSSGATTGALTVPFFLALAVGVSALKKNSIESESDSFGLVAIVSAGAIMGVMLMGIFTKLEGLVSTYEEYPNYNSIIAPFLEELPHLAAESAVAMVPLFIIYIAFQVWLFRFNKKQFMKIAKGLLYTYIGLVLFLCGVNAGFMAVGSLIGSITASFDNKLIVILIGFALGFVTVMAEPAVHVLTDQIELVTSGYVKKPVVLGALSIGVGCAVSLSILRVILPGIQLWHYLLPGYILSVSMAYFVPKLFVGIAFDAGGVATGPMTATFILAFSQGVAHAVPGAGGVSDAFGMIALVAMTPIITLQTLGLIVMIKAKAHKKAEILPEGDDD